MILFSGPQGEKGEPGTIGPPGSTAVVKADGETLLVLVSIYFFLHEESFIRFIIDAVKVLIHH